MILTISSACGTCASEVLRIKKESRILFLPKKLLAQSACEAHTVHPQWVVSPHRKYHFGAATRCLAIFPLNVRFQALVWNLSESLEHLQIHVGLSGTHFWWRLSPSKQKKKCSSHSVPKNTHIIRAGWLRSPFTNELCRPRAIARIPLRNQKSSCLSDEENESMWH